jgi:hypothetical protein
MFGTYEAGYDRNQVLMRGMREAGIEVVECHVPLWETMWYKTSAFKGPAQYVVIAAKLALAYAQLCVRYLLAPPHDIVLVGYLGHFDVFPAHVLSWLRRKPLVFDAFVSREFQRFVRCRMLAHGFARFRCNRTAAPAD